LSHFDSAQGDRKTTFYTVSRLKEKGAEIDYLNI
jgi:hypothetical protein